MANSVKVLLCLFLFLASTFCFAKTDEESLKQEKLKKAQECLDIACNDYLENKWLSVQANLQVAINNGLESDEIYYLLLQSQMNMNSYDKANATCDIFLSKYEDSQLAQYVYYQKGMSLYAQNRLDFAAEAFSTCCLYYPKGSLYLQSFFKAAECFYNMGNVDDAKTVYTAIVAEYPETEEGKESVKRLQSIQNKVIPVWKDPQLSDGVNTSMDLVKLKAKSAEVELLLMEMEGN